MCICLFTKTYTLQCIDCIIHLKQPKYPGKLKIWFKKPSIIFCFLYSKQHILVIYVISYLPASAQHFDESLHILSLFIGYSAKLYWHSLERHCHTNKCHKWNEKCLESLVSWRMRLWMKSGEFNCWKWLSVCWDNSAQSLPFLYFC